jgi:hypothetical protein
VEPPVDRICQGAAHVVDRLNGRRYLLAGPSPTLGEVARAQRRPDGADEMRRRSVHPVVHRESPSGGGRDMGWMMTNLTRSTHARLRRNPLDRACRANGTAAEGQRTANEVFATVRSSVEKTRENAY